MFKGLPAEPDEANNRAWSDYLNLMREVRGDDAARRTAADEDIRFLFRVRAEELSKRLRREGEWADARGGPSTEPDQPTVGTAADRWEGALDDLNTVKHAIDEDDADFVTMWAVSGAAGDAIDYLIEHVADSEAGLLGLVNLAGNPNLTETRIRRIVELDLDALGRGVQGFGPSLTYEQNVLLNLASNEATSPEVLRALAAHPHRDIGEEAQDTLRHIASL